ncbi:MAG: sugar phosphate isomerase/epimerase family protein [Candidatus Korarchaeota archaeon]|nr:sugar phosphate isomerase/epimerase [Thermoproteota archaeon]MCR8471454.1 sugar phosphate isomerase/epimerase [Thermoproteota archaeon]MCR8473297.1 sugar phosphate isomerase/epimerase [Thermoproteota archaeon]MCR8488053.1 sugar phosphate isomerase/epimerase [Thermoproteota archaeon]
MKTPYVHLFQYPVEKQLSISKDRGLNCLLGLTANRLMELNSNTVKLIKDFREKIDVAVHAPPHDMLLGSLDPAIRQVTKMRLLETIKLASDIRATYVVVHLNYVENMHKYFKEAWIENSVEVLEELLQQKIKIYLENAYERDPEIFHKVFRMLQSDLFGFTLDVGHAIAYSNVPLETWISKLSSYIKELHVHETRPGSDEHLAVGSGLIDWGHVFSKLEENGISLNELYITIEPRDENALDKSIEYLKILGLI